MATVQLPTADGPFVAVFSANGLARLSFPREREPAASRASCGSLSPEWIELTAASLENALQGLPPSQLPPLDLSCGTPFQRAVWLRLLQIPSGTTITYSELAEAVGRPKAVRAAGQACGANPIPVLVPCHRVLAAHGRLGGFSGGLDWKIELLRREDQKLFKTSINCRNRP